MPETPKKIAIIDYQMGNLRSVQKAFEKVGANAVITSDPREVWGADKVVLPGVGAFRDAIAELRRRDLVTVIKDVVAAKKPFLGICLGLQLLFDVSYEDGVHDGIGIVPGEVRKFELPPGLKNPHMGWNQVNIVRPSPILNGIPNQAFFYFVHSYYVVPRDESVVALTTNYPSPFCSAIAVDNLFATQFHPEKSQANGLSLLKNFGEVEHGT